jgi:hypothetical protein
MRIQPEYMSFENRCTISSNYEFQAHQQRSQRRCCFPRMLYCDSRCSQTLTGSSLALPGDLLCNATCRLGDWQRVIMRQRVRGSVSAVRAVRNTQVFQTETRVVADAAGEVDSYLSDHGGIQPKREVQWRLR